VLIQKKSWANAFINQLDAFKLQLLFSLKTLAGFELGYSIPEVDALPFRHAARARRGQCYDFYFRIFSPIFGEKIGVLLKTNDQSFAFIN
jgi:hypothetical protein